MTKHLTADLIAEALAAAEADLLEVQPAEGWGCTVVFTHKGDGVLRAFLWDRDGNEIETRVFRLVEVE